MIITDANLLRVECSDVLPEEVVSIRTSLEKELRYSYEMGRAGIGLAAPQIGIPKNMAIIRIISDKGTAYNIDLVNCHIQEEYDSFVFENEGCLSFPNASVRTKRYNEIYVVDNMVEPHTFIATGLPAVCIQHEIDHLNGILLLDRLFND